MESTLFTTLTTSEQASVSGGRGVPTTIVNIAVPVEAVTLAYSDNNKVFENVNLTQIGQFQVP